MKYECLYIQIYVLRTHYLRIYCIILRFPNSFSIIKGLSIIRICNPGIMQSFYQVSLEKSCNCRTISLTREHRPYSRAIAKDRTRGFTSLHGPPGPSLVVIFIGFDVLTHAAIRIRLVRKVQGLYIGEWESRRRSYISRMRDT